MFLIGWDVFRKNKIPYISETLFVLKPKDIAKAKNAFCSQQAIWFNIYLEIGF